ncbi:hypothetical protein QO003_001708 [Arthrobacter silviterrae]|uniref:SDR family oxidoreductase n=1 Tax=Arthrobacter silviterrae TaxID=2026658 RepID=A0ABX0DHL7_9MICC|nr:MULTISPECIES: hypothetical protein [Arthrobacter]MCU6479655.1 hypothetical protein [Arthrobacter sp. A2-55]MDQ0277405.1 hypothetical protein [Arthrobacter silviterrae]NGN85236.1 hypothetical protein [Arthrobacter silviterrae]
MGGIEPEKAVQLLFLGVGDGPAVTVDAGAVGDRLFCEGRRDHGAVKAGPFERDEGFGHAK